MEKKDFFETVSEMVKSRLEENCQVVLKEITKNNHVILNGLMIGRQGCNVAPTIYIDSFWQTYRAGMSIDAIVDKIIEVYRREAPKEELNMEFFKEFAAVKSKICYKLINYRENEELLKKIPHIPYLDLAICFYYSFWDEEIGNGSILIYDTHMELWGTNTEELWKIAAENTPKLCPAVFCTMEEILAGIHADTTGNTRENENMQKSEESGIPMYILSNKMRILGASVVLYENVLEEISEQNECDMFVIPSSIHEVILLKDDKETDGSCIKKIIHEVNETQVDPQERLSESLYKYERKKKKIVIYEDTSSK